jgi:hypothetical protein
VGSQATPHPRCEGVRVSAKRGELSKTHGFLIGTRGFLQQNPKRFRMFAALRAHSRTSELRDRKNAWVLTAETHTYEVIW